MKLAYYRDLPNFGDRLNPLLAEKLFGNIFDDDRRHHFLFIGTMIRRRARQGCRETILGAGAGYDSGTYSRDRREILCVRGPVTCDLLRIDHSLAATDPAILASRFYGSGASTSGCLFMPHQSTHVRAERPLRTVCEAAGLTYVSPFDDTERTIRTIAGARRIVTEALHGAVVAESFEVPWVPVVFGAKVLIKKWQDFAASIGASYAPVEIGANMTFDGRVRLSDRIKHAACRLGLGKEKYKHLPVRRAMPSDLLRLEQRLRALATGDQGLARAGAAKAAAITRLDEAISRFVEARAALEIDLGEREIAQPQYSAP